MTLLFNNQNFSTNLKKRSLFRTPSSFRFQNTRTDSKPRTEPLIDGVREEEEGGPQGEGEPEEQIQSRSRHQPAVSQARRLHRAEQADDQGAAADWRHVWRELPRLHEPRFVPGESATSAGTAPEAGGDGGDWPSGRAEPQRQQHRAAGAASDLQRHQLVGKDAGVDQGAEGPAVAALQDGARGLCI